MTKVSVISVNLDIDGIIAEEITALSGQTRGILSDLRETQLETARAKQKIVDAEEATKQKLLDAIQKLIDAGHKGLPVTELYTFVTPDINTNTLTAKMKNHLKSTGSEWALVKQKINKVDRYILIPYNRDEAPE